MWNIDDKLFIFGTHHYCIEYKAYRDLVLAKMSESIQDEPLSTSSSAIGQIKSEVNNSSKR